MSERSLFLTALDIDDPAARAAYLDDACAGDAALRGQVEALLQSHQGAGQFLEQPAVVQLSAAPMAPSPEATLAQGPATDKEKSSDPGPRPTAPSIDARPHEEHEDLPFLAPSAQPDHLGRLGHYEVESVIGKGGFGVVLKAFDEKLRRVVAIKVLSPAYAAVGSARKRFIREAQSAAAVKNEHVVAIYSVQDDAQPPYLVMELIDGISLQDKLDRKGPLSLKEILRIGLQMAEGLAAAHKQGLVHRDIKPANILLENGVERVKITDFGLARAVDDASVTQSGTVAGTPMYMSPEQAEGLPVDHRSDLFSLGTVLYAMCTGHPPFRASGTMAVLKRVCEDTPRPIREINSDIPPWLVGIVDKLHAKKPDDRCQSVREVADMLGKYLSEIQLHGGILANSEAAASNTQPRPRSETVLNVIYSVVACLFLLRLLVRLIGPLERSLFPLTRYLYLDEPIVAIVVSGALALLALSAYGRRRKLFGGLTVLLAVLAVAVALIGFIDWRRSATFLVEANDPDVRVTITSADERHTHTLGAQSEVNLPPGTYRVDVRCGAAQMIEFMSMAGWGQQRRFPGGQNQDHFQIQLPRGNRATLTVQVIPLQAKGPPPPVVVPLDPDDKARLQGEWVAESGEAAGKQLPPEKVASTLKFQGNKLSMAWLGGKGDNATFELDTTADPKKIDLISPNKRDLGIYRFDGERLVLGIGDKGERPADFTTKAGTNRQVIVYKRASAK